MNRNKARTAALILFVIPALTGCFLKPVTVTGFQPKNGETVDNSAGRVVLKWTALDGASGYSVQTSTDKDFNSDISTYTTTDDSFKIPDPQTNPVTLYWRVRPLYSALLNRGAWSEPQTLTISHPPVKLIELGSLAQGRTCRNTAGLAVNWKEPVPLGTEVYFEIYHPVTGETLWKGTVTEDAAIPFSDINGIAYSDRPTLLGIRYSMKNRFGETSDQTAQFAISISDPWLPLDLSQNFHPDFQPQNFPNSSDRIFHGWAVCPEDVSAFTDKSLTGNPIRIPRNATVAVESLFPEMLSQEPLGMGTALLPLVEIKYKGKTCWVNGDNLLFLSASAAKANQEVKPGIAWRFHPYTDKETGVVSIIPSAELVGVNRSHRFPLVNYLDPEAWTYIVTKSFILEDIDNDGQGEISLEYPFGCFESHVYGGRERSEAVYGLVLRETETGFETVMEELLYQTGSSEMGDFFYAFTYLYKDLDGDGIRETCIVEGPASNPYRDEGLEYAVDIWKRDPLTGRYNRESGGSIWIERISDYESDYEYNSVTDIHHDYPWGR